MLHRLIARFFVPAVPDGWTFTSAATRQAGQESLAQHDLGRLQLCVRTLHYSTHPARDPWLPKGI